MAKSMSQFSQCAPIGIPIFHGRFSFIICPGHTTKSQQIKKLLIDFYVIHWFDSIIMIMITIHIYQSVLVCMIFVIFRLGAMQVSQT